MKCFEAVINPIFGTAHGWGAKRSPLHKICHTYPTMMKLGTVIPYLQKIEKIYKSSDTHPELYWHQHFFTGNQQILLHEEYRYRLHFDTWFLVLLTFLESLKIFLINMVVILITSAKIATPGLLEITVFWNTVHTDLIQSMTSPTKFYHGIQIIL